MKPSETQTRKEIIDKRLFEAGWNVEDRTQVTKEFYIKKEGPDSVHEPAPKYGSGRLFSDYVLLGKDGAPLAVVETPFDRPRPDGVLDVFFKDEIGEIVAMLKKIGSMA